MLDGEPGHELQVDTGWVGWLTLPERKKRRFRAFIFTAVRSRHRFVYPSFEETTARAIEACEAAWDAYCERFIGTARRECLDRIIPLNERHLRQVLAEWMTHYNAERPHSARGPGLPDNSRRRAIVTGHRLADGWRVIAHQRLGGLHHHYALERAA